MHNRHGKEHKSGIDDLLEFMTEVERLKGVLRKSRPAGLERYEKCQARAASY